DGVVGPGDSVMGFGPPEGDAEVDRSLRRAGGRGAMTFALPGPVGTYAAPAATPDPFKHQELLELLYHTLWETVHVFFERRELGHEVGEAAFLYPFLGREKEATFEGLGGGGGSIRIKGGGDGKLRGQGARRASVRIGAACGAAR